MLQLSIIDVLDAMKRLWVKPARVGLLGREFYINGFDVKPVSHNCLVAVLLEKFTFQYRILVT